MCYVRHGGQCKIKGTIDYFRTHLHFLHRWLRDSCLRIDTWRPFICAWLLDDCCRTTVVSIRARVASLLNRMMCPIRVYCIERQRGLEWNTEKKLQHTCRKKLYFCFWSLACIAVLLFCNPYAWSLNYWTRSRAHAFAHLRIVLEETTVV